MTRHNMGMMRVDGGLFAGGAKLFAGWKRCRTGADDVWNRREGAYSQAEYEE